ncbi:MAG TPA: RNase adapter RapZ [Edaphocola sp.]|nr:RNase adapter RapZ [Edaphocola sp.]
MKQYKDFTEQINQLFKEQFGKTPEHIDYIPQSGSDRVYTRLIEGEHSAIAAYCPNVKENNTYLYFTEIFRKHQLSVPEIFQKGPNNKYYLMEDLGKNSLLDLLIQEGKTPEVKALFVKAVEDLVNFQWIAGNDIDYSRCFHHQSFDKNTILSDLNYFKYYFVDVLKIEYDKKELQEEFELWSQQLAGEGIKTFMYRDFQSRNIILNDGKPAYIDFQGGMYGLPHYDLASLLWQAKAQLPTDWKKDILDHYLKSIKDSKKIADIDEIQFKKTYIECVLLRILQTLGAYGNRGLIERKQHFISSIHPALMQLKEYLDEYSILIRFPELLNLLEALVQPNIVDNFYKPKQNEAKPLKIDIYSFSYKKGLPIDESDHGGGFVFDCRGILNPGRFEPYKMLTGKDYPVQEFLKTQTLMPVFLQNIFSTIDITIENYLSREFDRLSICFGCTGGQHRSVFAAEQTKNHLKEVYNIEANLIHLEQDENSIKRR